MPQILNRQQAGVTHRKRAIGRCCPRRLALYLAVVPALALFGCCGTTEDPADWGYASIDLFERIRIQDTSCILAYDFESCATTDRFDVRLYFPLVGYRFGHLGDTGLALLRSTDGLRFRLTDGSGIDTLVLYQVNYTGSYRGHSMYSSPGLPVGLWLGGGIKVRRGERYIARLELPPLEDHDQRFAEVILIGGDVGPVFP